MFLTALNDLPDGQLWNKLTEKITKDDFEGFHGANDIAEVLAWKLKRQGALVAAFSVCVSTYADALFFTRGRFEEQGNISYVKKAFLYVRMRQYRFNIKRYLKKLERALGMPSARPSSFALRNLQHLNEVSLYDLEVLGRGYLAVGEIEDAYQRFFIAYKRTLSQPMRSLVIVGMFECTARRWLNREDAPRDFIKYHAELLKVLSEPHSYPLKQACRRLSCMEAILSCRLKSSDKLKAQEFLNLAFMHQNMIEDSV